MMDFRILGALEVFHGGRAVAVGGSRQRMLLAVLLLHPNESLGTDRLIDELWGERPPTTAAKTVQVHISRLRKALSECSANGSGELIVTGGGGYRLRIDPESVDAHRFERLLAEGRTALAAGRADEAAAALEGSLSLWRGQALAEFAYERFAEIESGRLNDLRLAATEELVDAKLALGRHSEVVEELETLVAANPYRERLWGQLMLAFYRSDRQADALQAYQDARRALVEELGIEPGEHLREGESAILRQDPGLVIRGAGGARAAGAPPIASPRRRTGRRSVAAAAVLAVATAGALALALRGGSGQPSAPALDRSRNSVVALDAAGSSPALALPLAGRATDIVASGETAWISTVDSAAITSIDARRRTISRTVPMGGRPDAIAVGNGSVWVADGSRGVLVRLRPGYEGVVQEVRYPRMPPEQGGSRVPRSSVALGGGSVWLTNGSDRLIRVEPHSGRVALIPVGRPLNGVAVSGRDLWAISSSTATVLRLDQRRQRVAERIAIVSRPGGRRPEPVAIAATSDSVWVLNGNTATVVRIDPSVGGIAATTEIGVDRVPSDIAAAGSSAWVANGDGSVSRVDAGSIAATTTSPGGSLERVAVDHGRVWVTTTALEQKLPGGQR